MVATSVALAAGSNASFSGAEIGPAHGLCTTEIVAASTRGSACVFALKASQYAMHILRDIGKGESFTMQADNAGMYECWISSASKVYL